jgi:hypothetical protein
VYKLTLTAIPSRKKLQDAKEAPLEKKKQETETNEPLAI